MTPTRLAPALLAAAALAACGRSSATVDDFRAAAPTSANLAISQNDGDPAEGDDLSEETATAQSLAAGGECHPHLFVRTHEIIGRVNRHFFKHLHHVEELIANHPLADGETKTWEDTRGGLARRFTMTRTANLDGSSTYDFELDVADAPAGDGAAFVKVLWGTVTHIGPAAADADAGVADAGTDALVENKGVVNFDFTALASVSKRERARGLITDTFDNVRDPVNGVKRSASIVLKDFLPEEGDRHGPRSGSYTWLREPGVGGKFQFQDTVTLFCLRNPAAVQSDVSTVARWYKAADGGVRGRSDSKASGGQLTSGQAWMGVTCAKGQTTAAPAEGFWMMKLEDSTGATLAAQSAQIGTEPCDPVFGAVPSTTNNLTDYDFSAKVTFPGEW